MRITDAAHRTLKDLARNDRRTMLALLDEAVEALRRKRFLESTNDAFAALRKDPEASRALDAERRQWDATLLDGIAVHEEAPKYRTRRGKPQRGRR